MTDAPHDPPTVCLARLSSQLLAGPGSESAEGVVGHILAIQAQDARGFRLAIRSRSHGLSVVDVDDALNDRRLVVTWLNRGTLHLVRTEDYWWLHPLTAPRSASAINHRLRQIGIGDRQAKRGVDVIVEALNAEGPLTRRDLKDRLDAAGVPAGGQAQVYLLGMASLRGLIVRGPIRTSDQAFVSVDAWLGKPPLALGRDEALGRLAMRYLEGHEPATSADLAKWAGVTLGDARLGFSQLRDQIRPFGDGFVRQDRNGDIHQSLPTRLLGPFDPLLHGWASRDMWVGAHQSVITKNGIFRATVLSDGHTTGTWRLSSHGVQVELFEDIDQEASAELVHDGLDVLRFLRKSIQRPVISIEYPDR